MLSYGLRSKDRRLKQLKTKGHWVVELSVVKLDGTTDQQLAVSEDVFATAFREPLVHQVVVAYMSGTRSGTSSQKNRSDVSGGGSKPWRQKGTGRARAGTIRSPIWRGGGRAFPATARSYSQKVNRKMYRAALRSILSELIRQERLRVCDEIQVSQPKTKVMTDVLAKLGLSGRVLLVLLITIRMCLSLLEIYQASRLLRQRRSILSAWSATRQ